MCGVGNLSKNRFQILSRLLTNIWIKWNLKQRLKRSCGCCSRRKSSPHFVHTVLQIFSAEQQLENNTSINNISDRTARTVRDQEEPLIRVKWILRVWKWHFIWIFSVQNVLKRAVNAAWASSWWCSLILVFTPISTSKLDPLIPVSSGPLGRIIPDQSQLDRNRISGEGSSFSCGFYSAYSCVPDFKWVASGLHVRHPASFGCQIFNPCFQCLQVICRRVCQSKRSPASPQVKLG